MRPRPRLLEANQRVGLWSGPRFARLRIGLLGGSFNPPHPGHVHVSRQAALALGLDMVWWLVSPGNPLKDPDSYIPFEERLDLAKQIAAPKGLVVTDIEAQLKSRLTVETLTHLIRRMPRVEFVWLMGADNLESFQTWHKWSRIFHSCPIAVVGRPTYSLRALNSQAAIRFKSSRRKSSALRARRQRLKAPIWTFVSCRLHDASSSKIRREAGISL